MSEATPTSSVLPFFLSSFAWNFTPGTSYPLVPLYAHDPGMTGIGIGTLVALLCGLGLIPMHRWALAKPDNKRDNRANS